MSEFLLQVDKLKIHFPVFGGVLWRKIGAIHAVDGVSFNIIPGQTLGLVGESGCGKTTVGRGILRLYRPTEGRVLFKGTNISDLTRKEIRHVRKDMQMIFQDPFESLNSRHTIGNIIEEPLLIHGIGSVKDREERVTELLARVGIQQQAVAQFPHEFSGGQRQRIGIARAIALNPELIVCDEPVSALDVSIQSQILNLLLELQEEMNLTYLFIAHDLSVVKHISDRIAVMYLGKIVEYADADELYETPLHPYTRALISAIPVPDPLARKKRMVVTGDVPSPRHPPSGCRFHTRCPLVTNRCRNEEPLLAGLSGLPHDSHLVACHRAGK